MTEAVNMDVCIIGGGPAGLMAAEMVADAGLSVVVADAMPTLGRKFLMAGKSGLNLTKDEPLETLLSAYGSASEWLRPTIEGFDATAVQAWASGLGQQVFTGSTGRVFPRSMKASPLLRALLSRLDKKGVQFRTRWRWTGWKGANLGFQTPQGAQIVTARATILALGGASWPRLGSDGAWGDLLLEKGVPLVPFRPSNMGFEVEWSPHMATHFGQPIKNVVLHFAEVSLRGEFVLSRSGVEGSAIYALSARLRDAMGPDGLTLTLDLHPDLPVEEVSRRLARPRGKASIANHLRKTLGLSGARLALLHEAGPLGEMDAIAARIKALPLHLRGPCPIDEAISTAGGVMASALDENLMLRALPGVFCAGEMLDWEAPTGGYLITGCLATGRWAGLAALRWLSRA